jgi:hypothetical protein
MHRRPRRTPRSPWSGGGGASRRTAPTVTASPRRARRRRTCAGQRHRPGPSHPDPWVRAWPRSPHVSQAPRWRSRRRRPGRGRRRGRAGCRGAEAEQDAAAQPGGGEAELIPGQAGPPADHDRDAGADQPDRDSSDRRPRGGSVRFVTKRTTPIATSTWKVRRSAEPAARRPARCLASMDGGEVRRGRDVTGRARHPPDGVVRVPAMVYLRVNAADLGRRRPLDARPWRSCGHRAVVHGDQRVTADRRAS